MTPNNQKQNNRFTTKNYPSISVNQRLSKKERFSFTSKLAENLYMQKILQKYRPKQQPKIKWNIS